jgi:hypothetical protein
MKTQSQWLFESPFPSMMDRYTYSYTNLGYDYEWLFEAPTVLPVTPPFLAAEPLPTGLTLYTKIPLGGESSAQPMTGIFIPSGYRVNSQVDLIIYLHGHHRDDVIKKGKTEKKPAPGYTPVTLSINQHWNAAFYPYFAFREGVNASGKNVILVAPTLGPRSQSGRLIQHGGFDAYMDQVMAFLSSYGPHKKLNQAPTVRNIILACHSGGGASMQKIANATNSKYGSQIGEYWGFDCTYGGDADAWRKWAKAHPSGKVYIYYRRTCSRQDPTKPKRQWGGSSCPSSPSGCANPKTPIAGRIECTGTTLEAMKLASFKLPKVCVGVSRTGDHNKVPITYWEDRIKAAPFLHNR